MPGRVFLQTAKLVRYFFETLFSYFAPQKRASAIGSPFSISTLIFIPLKITKKVF